MLLSSLGRKGAPGLQRQLVEVEGCGKTFGSAPPRRRKSLFLVAITGQEIRSYGSSRKICHTQVERADPRAGLLVPWTSDGKVRISNHDEPYRSYHSP